MLVVPPSLSTIEAAAVYRVKVTHDLFDPTFFVTTVRRGGRSNGPVMGDFKWVFDIYICERGDMTDANFLLSPLKDEARLLGLGRDSIFRKGGVSHIQKAH